VNGQARWGESSMPFERLEEMFGEWMRGLPANRRPGRSFWAEATRGDRPAPDDVAEGGPAAEVGIAVDEYRDDDVHVVRAALPGIDPDRDVELTTVDGELRIVVEAGPEDDRTYLRRELRRARTTRALALPERARPGEITASYRDGILEIRIPLVAPPVSETTRINVTRG
jgi:HSP20 family protein